MAGANLEHQHATNSQQDASITIRNNKKPTDQSARGEIAFICGPGGIRTRGLFIAVDKNAGEKAKIAVLYV